MDKLKLRNSMKKKKPRFERQYANVMKQFEDSWNRPRGMHSKMRKGYRGKKRMPTVGYRSPVEVRGLTRAGLEPVVVHNIQELQKVDSKKHSVLVAAGLGMRKRVELFNKSTELKLQIANVKDIGKYVNDVKQTISERQKLASERKNKKEKKKVEKVEKETKDKEKNKDSSEKSKEVKKENNNVKGDVKTDVKADSKAEAKVEGAK